MNQEMSYYKKDFQSQLKEIKARRLKDKENYDQALKDKEEIIAGLQKVDQPNPSKPCLLI